MFYKQKSNRLVMFQEKISNRSSISQKVKQQSKTAKQQTESLVILKNNKSNFVKNDIIQEGSSNRVLFTKLLFRETSNNIKLLWEIKQQYVISNTVKMCKIGH